ncbi:TlpA family protein disulfide reductase [Pararcticibacter amylolyticus]|uniref:Alkyl hydroperoxide reductase n=1 Tax=Pararcticibacter amylolyticus TaxID=2173175 RepID=A0A2U2PHI6_9SPHI|nr:TlpA disulfide reductase family protein [Pararcticibacter amylolyticus]PWG80722.1 alkyl hydroperoxide reductase [Pararcticibacter amylolyticus]
MKKLLFLLSLMLSTAMAQTKTTTYTGTIKGYTSNAGFKTGKIYVTNVVTGVDDMYLIDVAPEGTFTVDFPLRMNKECWVSFPFFNGIVYFESGKKVVQDFDITNTAKVTSVFKGYVATTNNDLNKVRPIFSYDWDAIYSDIYQSTPEQYKAYFLQLQSQKLTAIDSMRKNKGLNATACRLATDNIKYEIAGTLIYYNDTREVAYRKKNNIAFTSRTPVLKKVKLDSAYYSFLRSLKYNDPSAMAAFNYKMFINRLMFLDLIYDKAGRIDYTKEINDLKQRGDTTDRKIRESIEALEKSMLYNATVPGTMEKARPVVLKSLLNTDITLELELMDLQDVCQNINNNKMPLSDKALARLKARLKHPYLFTEVLQLNNKVKQAIEASKAQTGYTNNETPGTVADSVFDKIMNKYKGKVVFIDFWATWCSPCLEGIQEMAPLKAELKDENIVFLYITNNTSPEKTYSVMSPGIKGEHYRVTSDEYNVLSERFRINGIPHYAIANKKGIVVDSNFHWTDHEKLKEKLLQMTKE